MTDYGIKRGLFLSNLIHALPDEFIIPMKPRYRASLSLGAIFETMLFITGDTRFSPIVMMSMSPMRSARLEEKESKRQGMDKV